MRRILLLLLLVLTPVAAHANSPRFERTSVATPLTTEDYGYYATAAAGVTAAIVLVDFVTGGRVLGVFFGRAASITLVGRGACNISRMVAVGSWF